MTADKQGKKIDKEKKEDRVKNNTLNPRERILLGTMEAFKEKGLKFTMDDLAKSLCMSKKTLYKYFRDKEELFLAMVEYMFDSIAESKREVLKSRGDTMEKIRRILGVMPEGYSNLDLRQLYGLRADYPEIYKEVEKRLESGWEETLELLQQGMEEGVIRKLPLCLVKLMMEATLEQFFQRDILVQNNLTYQQALDEVIDILLDGIRDK